MQRGIATKMKEIREKFILQVIVYNVRSPLVNRKVDCARSLFCKPKVGHENHVTCQTLILVTASALLFLNHCPQPLGSATQQDLARRHWTWTSTNASNSSRTSSTEPTRLGAFTSTAPTRARKGRKTQTNITKMARPRRQRVSCHDPI
jgi:hypothetical protein